MFKFFQTIFRRDKQRLDEGKIILERVVLERGPGQSRIEAQILHVPEGSGLRESLAGSEIVTFGTNGRELRTIHGERGNIGSERR